MGEELESQEFKNVTSLIMESIKRLETDYKLNRNEIADKIGEEIQSFWKYARGEFPKTKLDKLWKMLRDLQALEKLEKERLYPTVEGSSLVREPENNLMIIYFDFLLKTEPYKGVIKVIGATTDHNGAAGVIALPNNSFKDADGVVPMNDPGADSKVACGSLIAIKKIEIGHCRSGYWYYFFDHAKQPYLRKLQILENGQYRLISNNPVDFSDIDLKPQDIAAAFKVLTVSYDFYD